MTENTFAILNRMEREEKGHPLLRMFEEQRVKPEPMKYWYDDVPKAKRKVVTIRTKKKERVPRVLKIAEGKGTMTTKWQSKELSQKTPQYKSEYHKKFTGVKEGVNSGVLPKMKIDEIEKAAKRSEERNMCK